MTGYAAVHTAGLMREALRNFDAAAVMGNSLAGLDTAGLMREALRNFDAAAEAGLHHTDDAMQPATDLALIAFASYVALLCYLIYVYLRLEYPEATSLAFDLLERAEEAVVFGTVLYKAMSRFLSPDKDATNPPATDGDGPATPPPSSS